MRIVVTGGDGFIGRNLRLRLQEAGFGEVTSVTLATEAADARAALLAADFVFHLAGVNRPQRPEEFEAGNVGYTRWVREVLESGSRAVPIAFTSSTQVALDNAYGRSKRSAEEILEAYGRNSGAPIYLLRLTNVFGKWSQPHYNSAVATFCYNLIHGLPIVVHDPAAPLCLLYIDDAVDGLLRLLTPGAVQPGLIDIGPTHSTTVGEVAGILQGFADSRHTLVTPPVGTGLRRALWATYLSFLPPAQFDYPLARHGDARGVFVEILKTLDNGQFSFFTAQPGATRGEHYHHTKTEKFLVARGTASFRFRHVLTGQTHEILVNGAEPRVVETVPGWVHNVTNVGEEELVVMLWSSELFDPERPDAAGAKVNP